MDIRKIKGALNSYELTSTSSLNKDTNTRNSIPNSKKEMVEISNTAIAMTGSLDKGTAAQTTLYVDHSTFQQIANYTTNNSECQWSEIGVDGEKRWIVVNGQRFESPLSEAEKERRQERLEEPSMTLIDYLEEYEDNKATEKDKSKDVTTVEIDFNGSQPRMNKQIENDKLTNLFGNEKVMEMLKDISKKRGGKISLATS
ncbi:hypothetical protein [Psychrobacillus psychrodurans]|uniref:hypothetical protein n=1 Tax=Psychrobacillus psychrodurans TaxID=126157 RepID=UPI0008EA5F19|nr:hypothetical protein [Psychrobacillus psychrodurans]MCZ8542314.1 hypothetical protein [Psychrobacillus psychrodurans]SFN25452.1 hypothetical protein SAMN05421832_12715 [Psychrobacillus psychrodurans]